MIIVGKKVESASRIKQHNYELEDFPVEEYILNFDVLNSTAEQARELVAWLQLELKLQQNMK